MSVDERTRTAWHEAGHSVVGFVVGARLGAVTIRGGSAATGCATVRPRAVPRLDRQRCDTEMPFLLWPARVRRRFEAEVMVFMAGEIAEWLFVSDGARPVRGAEPIGDRAIEVLPATVAEHAWAESACNDSAVRSDAEVIAQIAYGVHAGDHASAGTWIHFLDAQTTDLVRRHHRLIDRLAGELLEHETLGARAVRELLRRGPM